jgi:hypothetical protein
MVGGTLLTTAGCGGSGDESTTTSVSVNQGALAKRASEVDREEREKAVARANEEVAEARVEGKEKEPAEQQAADNRLEERHRRIERELEQEEQAGEDAPPEFEAEPVTPGEVTKAEFGKKWPLSVPSGLLRCESFGPELGEVIFTAPDGTEYGLNGTAQDGGYPPIDPIWLYEPGMKRYGLKINIGPLIDRGLALC